MTSPMSYTVDGKLWAQNNGFAGVHRLDLNSGKWETWDPFKDSPRGHNTYDRIARLDSKSGQVVEYLLPKSTNVRRVFVDDSTAPVTFWVGSNHGASIIKLEPFD